MRSRVCSGSCCSSEYTDRVLGAIVQRLRRLGHLPLGDGRSGRRPRRRLHPGQSRRLLGAANAGWILRVPMFVKLPGQRRGQDHLAPGADDRPAADDRRRPRHPHPLARRRALRCSALPSRVGPTPTSATGRRSLHIPPAAVRRGFRIRPRGSQRLPRPRQHLHLRRLPRRLRGQLRGARPIEVSVESPGGTDRRSRVRLLPLLVYGSILDPRSRRTESPLIAKLNGRIVAVGQSVDGGTRFTLLIPPGAFRSPARTARPLRALAAAAGRSPAVARLGRRCPPKQSHSRAGRRAPTSCRLRPCGRRPPGRSRATGRRPSPTASGSAIRGSVSGWPSAMAT